jgi:DNA repair protein RadC
LDEVKLTVKRSKRIPATAITVRTPADLAKIAFIIADKTTIAHHETMIVIAFSAANTPGAFYKVGEGGISAAIADIRMVFQMLLLCNASSFALVHNHPSGNLEPSREDIVITREMKQVGELHGIKLLDHIILTPEKSFTSLSERGII